MAGFDEEVAGDSKWVGDTGHGLQDGLGVNYGWGFCHDVGQISLYEDWWAKIPAQSLQRLNISTPARFERHKKRRGNQDISWGSWSRWEKQREKMAMRKRRDVTLSVIPAAIRSWTE